jgi:hypothetical protein
VFPENHAVRFALQIAANDALRVARDAASELACARRRGRGGGVSCVPA